MGSAGALWIVWPKKPSGLEADLDGNAIRAFGLARGLVDYKIAAIDAHLVRPLLRPAEDEGLNSECWEGPSASG